MFWVLKQKKYSQLYIFPKGLGRAVLCRSHSVVPLGSVSAGTAAERTPLHSRAIPAMA